MSTVSALPDPPSRAIPSNFATRADAWNAALVTWTTQVNTVAGEVNTNATNAATSASTATTQAGIATTQAALATTNGAAQVTLAAAQVTLATAQVALATTQAGNSATSASNSAASYTSSNGVLTTIRTYQLTAKAGDPSVNDNGGALTAGTTYFNTTSVRTRIYNGAAWQDAVGAITGVFSVAREVQTATAAQTAFTLTNTYAVGLNAITVYLNGIRLYKTTDYLETSASVITLTSGAALNDVLLFEIGIVTAGSTTSAGLTSFNPTGGIASGNVQAALVELESDTATLLAGKQATLVSGTNIKTVNSTSLLGAGDIAITVAGAGGQTITGNVTLTATGGLVSNAAISVVPANPGLYVTLPVATGVNKGVNVVSVYNNGDYDYGVKDSAGTQLGWVRPKTGAIIGLADNTTAAGVWAPYGLEKLGITAQYVNPTALNQADNLFKAISLDADRTCFLFGGTTHSAIIYNASTQSWGTATTVRTGASNNFFTGIKSATDQVLVCSCDTSTGFQAVTLTISGTGITVNSAVSVVLAGNIADFLQLIAVSTSWVVAYGRDTTVSGIRAITIAGTVPTIGSESILDPAVASTANIYASGSIVRTVIASAASLSCKPFTVTGSSLAAGTAATATVSQANVFRTVVNGNGNIVANYINANHSATIFKLTGTVEAASTVVVSSTLPAAGVSFYEYLAISASKTLFLSYVSGTPTWYANILTDTAGTASVGTQITGDITGNIGAIQGISAVSNIGRIAYSSSTAIGQWTFDCSGTSPVISSLERLPYSPSSLGMGVPAASDKLGVRSAKSFIAGNTLYCLGTNSTAGDTAFGIGRIGRSAPLPVANSFGVVGLTTREAFLTVFAGSSIGRIIQRVEAAA